MLDETEFQTLLKQIEENIRLAHYSFSDIDCIQKIYQLSINPQLSDTQINNETQQIEEIIEDTCKNWLKTKGNLEDKDIKTKVINQIEKIKSKVGILYPSLEQGVNGINLSKEYINRYLTKNYIQFLTIAIIENRIINETFPIYVERIEIKNLTPTSLKQCNSKDGSLTEDDITHQRFLNQSILKIARELLLEEDQQNKVIDTGIESQPSYEITVYFYIKKEKLSKNVQKFIGDQYNQSDLRFSMRSYGTGGQLTQITRVINRALLWDIKCLRDKYFPVAHDVMIYPDIFRNNISSPMLSTNLVKIYSLDEVKRRLKQLLEATTDSQNPSNDNKNKDNLTNGTAQSIYCAFDLLETMAKSLLLSRLKALANLGVDKDQYMKDLITRNREAVIAKEAKKLVDNFPFSLSAMSKYLDHKFSNPNEDKDFFDWLKKQKGTENISYTMYNMALSLIEEYLNQGFYCKACKYLTILQPKLENDSENLVNFLDQSKENNSITEDLKIFSGYTFAKYKLVKAKLFYLSINSTEEENCSGCSLQDDDSGECLNSCQGQERDSVYKSLFELQKSLKHLQLRYLKYVVVKEYSQGTFYPYYLVLAKIYFLKAKIFTFFPKIITEWLEDKQDELGSDLIKQFYIPTFTQFKRNLDLTDDSAQFKQLYYNFCRIYCLEKARIYAARSGDTELYTCYTGYQSIAYSVAVDSDQLYGNILSKINFNKDNCLKWAKALILHSGDIYAEIGKQYYYQIKEESGKGDYELKNDDNLTILQIAKIPAIQEVHDNNVGLYRFPNSNNEILNINTTSLLKEHELLNPRNSNQNNIYLFGVNASIFLFARGIYLLSKNDLPSDKNEQEKILSEAYSYFTYAWSIADDSCDINKPNTDQDKQKTTTETRLRRNFHYSSDRNKNITPYDFPQESSIRDLYPYRLCELPDIGKIFAALCQILLCSLDREDNCKSHLDKIDILLSKQKLQNTTLSNNYLLCEQKKFNTHISNFFNNIKNQFIDQLNQQINQQKSGKFLYTRQEIERNPYKIQEYKEQLIKLVYGSLYEESQEIFEDRGENLPEIAPYKTIKIFLASSSELKSDRDQFEIFIGRENKTYIKEGIFLELVMWEDFIDAMSQTHLQDEYNKAISECDIFVSLFYTKVGKYTEEEFLKALDTFKVNDKPKIYTYFKKGQVDISEMREDQIMSLLNFKKKLSYLGHFFTSYSDINDLKYQFSQQLIKILKLI